MMISSIKKQMQALVFRCWQRKSLFNDCRKVAVGYNNVLTT